MTDPREAAERVLYEVAWCFDERDLDGLGQCFTRDATLTFGVIGKPTFTKQGRAEIVDFQRPAIEDQSKRRRHVISNPALQFRPDASVLARSYLLLILVTGGTATLQASGWYEDQLVQSEGRWRIAQRLLQLDNRPNLRE